MYTLTNRSLVAIYSLQSLERLAFYAIRSLLPLYLTKKLALNPEEAFEIIGASVALTCFSSFFGGFLRDRLRNSFDLILLGFFWILLGIFFLQQMSYATLYLGLALANFGSGFIRPILPTFLSEAGHLASREKLYGYLYIAFNVGALAGTLGCAMLGEIIGWQWSFRLAAIFTSFALLETIFFARSHGWHASKMTVKVFLLSLPCIALLYAAIFAHTFLQILLPVSLLLAWVYLSKLFKKGHGTIEGKQKFREFCTLSSLFIIFFLVYDQQGLSLALFVDKMVDRELPSVLQNIFNTQKIPTLLFMNIDPLTNILLGSVMISLLSWLTLKGILKSFRAKFLAGLCVAALDLIFLSLLCTMGLPIPAWGVLIAFSGLVIGEQLVMPIGISAAGSLCPKEYISLTTSIWMMTTSVASLLSANLSGWLTPTEGLEPQEMLINYQDKFLIIAGGVLLVVAGMNVKIFLSKQPTT